ncbi:MAG: hypothetical protein KGY48_07055 [Wenzhouxiangellaceae bacterium]|nr:hypothetical protein [Wenzhouxiangellaceae bacterium]MBS3746723.1 hypothetical protein [Wenzhouxiangellaceae bacterium]MBS3823653.1 hypothetical protein [Wenzhouxiangellaceae bacterium]
MESSNGVVRLPDAPETAYYFNWNRRQLESSATGIVGRRVTERRWKTG